MFDCARCGSGRFGDADRRRLRHRQCLGGGENPDEIVTGYEVTGSQWKKALSVDRLNNVTVRLSLGKDLVTDIFIDGNVSYTKTDDENESWYVVRTEDCAYEYVLNDDEWMRREHSLDSEVLWHKLLGTESVIPVFAMFENMYSRFAYNADTNTYDAKLTVNSTPNYPISATINNASLKFENGYCVSIEYTVGGEEKAFIDYNLGNYGKTVIDLPDFESTGGKDDPDDGKDDPDDGKDDPDDGKDDPDDNPSTPDISRTVTAAEWRKALSRSLFFNVTITSRGYGEYYDGVVVQKLDLDENAFMTIYDGEVSIIAKTNGEYREYSKADGGDWSVSNYPTSDEHFIEDVSSMAMLSIFWSFKEQYSQFVFDEGKSAYIFSDEYGSWEIVFANGRIEKIVNNYSDGGTWAYAFSDYGTTVIEIPEVEEPVEPPPTEEPDIGVYNTLFACADFMMVLHRSGVAEIKAHDGVYDFTVEFADGNREFTLSDGNNVYGGNVNRNGSITIGETVLKNIGSIDDDYVDKYLRFVGATYEGSDGSILTIGFDVSARLEKDGDPIECDFYTDFHECVLTVGGKVFAGVVDTENYMFLMYFYNGEGYEELVYTKVSE